MNKLEQNIYKLTYNHCDLHPYQEVWLEQMVEAEVGHGEEEEDERGREMDY